MGREGSAGKIGAARPNPIPSHTCKYHKQGKSYRLKLYLQVTPGAEDCTQCQSSPPSVRAAVCTQGQTCRHWRTRTALFVHVLKLTPSYSSNPTNTTYYVSPSRVRRKSLLFRGKWARPGRIKIPAKRLSAIKKKSLIDDLKWIATSGADIVNPRHQRCALLLFVTVVKPATK